MNQKLFDYINSSPTAFHAVQTSAETLTLNGYTELYEGEEWSVDCGKGYFVRRNGSSLIAFRVPKGEFNGFMITAAHADSPCLKIKENGELCDGTYKKLSVERYGGMIFSSWFDRPLSIAGRVTVRTEGGVEIRLVDSKVPCAVIPNVAIHMNREVNNGMKYNPAVDLIPLFGGEKGDLCDLVASLAGAAKQDVLTHDLYVYNPQECVEWGEYISAPRLDDLQCAFSALMAFVDSEESGAMPIYALFDNEEVGSRTKQGAASTFLCDVIERIMTLVGRADAESRTRLLSNSLMLSCDNAHAHHPNHPEYSDKNHTVYMNKGIVIKYNANQSYTTDAVSSALFKLICDGVNVPWQCYANRADMAGGSTLGNISNTQVSLNTVDIGLAQLAMHSAYETAGSLDTEYMVRAIKGFYSISIRSTHKGYEIV